MKRMIRPLRASITSRPSSPLAIDHGDHIDQAALIGNAERREAVVAQHRVDFLRRQQGRAGPRHSAP